LAAVKDNGAALFGLLPLLLLLLSDTAGYP
jgi:hypothetical protein